MQNFFCGATIDGGRGSRALIVLTAFLGGLAVSGSAAAAQEQVAPTEARVITFVEAVDLALERNTDLDRARADVDLSGIVQTRERLDFVPQVSVSSSGRRSFGRSFSQEQGGILSDVTDLFDAGVSVRMNVFNGGEKIASLRQASLQEDVSRYQLERTRQDIVYQVVEGFTTLVLDRALAEVREQEVVAARELLQQVRRLAEVGRSPVSDVYQQEAVLAESEAALVEARRQVELAETRLIQVLELDPLAEYTFPAPELPDDDALAARAEYDLPQLMQVALAERADLAALELGVEASEQGVRAARSGYWPSLDLSFNYGSNWSSASLQPVPGTAIPPRTVTITPDDGDPFAMDVPGTGEDPDYRQPDFMEQLDGRRGGSLSLSFSMPIFDRLQTRTMVAQAEVQRLNARYDLQDQQQQIALQVRQALLDYRSAIAQQEASARRLEAAQRAAAAAERRYELGAATFVEVVQARSTLTSARSAALQARFNVLLAHRLIAYYTGTLAPENALLTHIPEELSR